MAAILEIFFKTFIRRTLRSGLRGIHLKGTLKSAPAVLVPNHHSWWDGYVMAELCWSQKQPFKLLMLHEQLLKYPFLKSVGALSSKDLRGALRSLQQGNHLILYPEGALKPAGPVREVRPGVKWFADRSGALLVPVALRVVMRGHQHPEAYLNIGAPCPPEQVESAINALLLELDGALSVCDPEAILPGYQTIMHGVGSDSEKLSFASVWLKKLLRLQ